MDTLNLAKNIIKSKIKTNQLKIIGHRGAISFAHENTLNSFKKAIELGVDMVELDVHKCKSGEVIVFHDFEVVVDGKKKLIDEMDFTEISSVTLPDGQKIPTLVEVLDLIDKKIGINVEIKGRGSVVEMERIIKEYINTKGWNYDHFLFSSFNHYFLDELKKIDSKYKIAPLVSGVPYGYFGNFRGLGIDAVVIAVAYINKDLIMDAMKRNYKVYVYTVNSENVFNKLKDLNLIEGIITDFPEKFLKK